MNFRTAGRLEAVICGHTDFAPCMQNVHVNMHEKPNWRPDIRFPPSTPNAGLNEKMKYNSENQLASVPSSRIV